jgi:hypothetical protein
MTPHIVERTRHDSHRVSPQRPHPAWQWRLAVTVVAMAILIAIAIIATLSASSFDPIEAPYFVT